MNGELEGFLKKGGGEGKRGGGGLCMSCTIRGEQGERGPGRGGGEMTRGKESIRPRSQAVMASGASKRIYIGPHCTNRWVN